MTTLAEHYGARVTPAALAARQRVRCAVPACRCTVARDQIPFSEWVCVRHWTAVTPRTKLRYRQALRMWRRCRATGETIGAITRHCAAVWAACKAEAAAAAGAAQ